MFITGQNTAHLRIESAQGFKHSQMNLCFAVQKNLFGDKLVWQFHQRERQ